MSRLGSKHRQDLYFVLCTYQKSNKVLLFWDPKTLVGFDLFCVWKTLLVVVVLYMENLYVPGWLPVHYFGASQREVEW